MSLLKKGLKAHARCLGPKRLDEAVAAVLSTATRRGKPSGRVVLCRGVRSEGVVFFTNYLSRKGREVRDNPHVALCFYWPALTQQVRVEGSIKKLSVRESDTYWARRPRISQIGGLASPQSQRISGPAEMNQRSHALSELFEGLQVPRPAHWGGYLVRPRAVEFWTARPGRLHERRLFLKTVRGWKKFWLAP